MPPEEAVEVIHLIRCRTVLITGSRRQVAHPEFQDFALTKAGS